MITVSQLNRYVKFMMEEDTQLSHLLVRGEISNLTIYHRSGHGYFTLKDKGAAVKAVIFKWNLEGLRFEPREGMSVVVQGSATIFEGTGNYQLNVVSMIPDGEGALAVAYEQLKEKLTAEGLFDPERKKPIPAFPKRICVITSSTGAVIQDIKNVLARRYPLVTLTLIHSRVQGEGAAKELTKALKFADSLKADLVIIGRGGGSAEDLWCFNDEELVRCVANCQTPIISAVGHETDFTLCDFAADLRAPTPSAAAELASPDLMGIKQSIQEMERRLVTVMKRRLGESGYRLGLLERALVDKSPKNRLKMDEEQLKRVKIALSTTMEQKIAVSAYALQSKGALLDSLSPLSVLGRGYSYTTIGKKVVSGIQELKKEDELTIHFADGTAKVKVMAKRKRKAEPSPTVGNKGE